MCVVGWGLLGECDQQEILCGKKKEILCGGTAQGLLKQKCLNSPFNLDVFL